MKKGNHAKGFNKKSVALIAAVALMLVGVIGGTIAWLTDTSDEVKNTFTPSDVDIELAETDADKDSDANKNSYKMVPGATITKDPEVTVKADSEACYVFVKLEKSKNFDTFMTYEMADGWTSLDGATGVYYREVDATDTDLSFGVIKDNTVTVRTAVTKEQMDGLTGDNYPTLTITAYAIQSEYLETDNMTEIWALAQANGSTSTTT